MFVGNGTLSAREPDEALAGPQVARPGRIPADTGGDWKVEADGKR